MNKTKRLSFIKKLLAWHLTANNREMPWKNEKDPYKIWLSEIILQQTRVNQGWSYYEKFILKYPTIYELAKAPDNEVFKLWEGLGYYNRCKNLIHTAKFICENYNGKFPERYNEIRLLKGIGPYTAAAIASFAFNQPFAVVDGNVFRILSRVFGIETPIDSTTGKEEFTILANELLDKKEPARYNQAIMDFGATICKPMLPTCLECTLQEICDAKQKGIIHHLPIKEKVLKKKNRNFYYFIFYCNDYILITKRTNKDIWQNLFQFYLIESQSTIFWDKKTLDNFLKEQFDIDNVDSYSKSDTFHQILTHQKIKAQFITIHLKEINSVLGNFDWVKSNKIMELPFPKIIHQFFSLTNH